MCHINIQKQYVSVALLFQTILFWLMTSNHYTHHVATVMHQTEHTNLITKQYAALVAPTCIDALSAITWRPKFNTIPITMISYAHYSRVVNALLVNVVEVWTSKSRHTSIRSNYVLNMQTNYALWLRCMLPDLNARCWD